MAHHRSPSCGVAPTSRPTGQRILLLASSFVAGLVTLLGLWLSPSLASPGEPRGGRSAGAVPHPRSPRDRGVGEGFRTPCRRCGKRGRGTGDRWSADKVYARRNPQRSAGRNPACDDRSCPERLDRIDGGTRFSVVRTYKTVPFVALRLSSTALDALRQSGRRPPFMRTSCRSRSSRKARHSWRPPRRLRRRFRGSARVSTSPSWTRA